MKPSFISNLKRPAVFPSAIFLGANFAIFAYGCWLINSLSLDAGMLFLSVLFTALVGTAENLLVFWWAFKKQPKLPGLRLAMIIGSMALAAVFLFSIVINHQQKPSRYVIFLLPTHTFEASIAPVTPLALVTALQFNTSLGNIPLDKIEYSGWEMRDGKLLLTDSAENTLRWSGKTGGEVQFSFQASQEGEVSVAWDGNRATFPLLSKKHGYTQSLDVPFYANQQSIILLGLLINLIIASSPLLFSIWQKKKDALALFFTEIVRGGEEPITRVEWALVAGSVVLALLLRVHNLNMWSLIGVDEYSHLIAAKFIVMTRSVDVTYQRSLWVVTVPISLAFRLLGKEVWAARLMGVLFNVLSVIPLYFIARKINRGVATLSIFLFATSPWEIMFARVIREYAYYPFYFYWIVYGMVIFLKKFPDSFRIQRHWKVLFAPSTLILCVALLLPPAYSMYVDPHSTFKLILLAYIVFLAFLLGRLDFKDRANKIMLSGIAMVVLLSGSFWLKQIILSIPAPGLNLMPLQYFIPNPAQQWYFDRLVVVPLIGVVAAIALSLMTRNRNSVPLFIALLFGIFLGFFLFFPNPPFFAPRHLSIANLWYIILMAIGLYILYQFVLASSLLKTRLLKIGAVLAIGLLSINPIQALFPTFSVNAVSAISRDYFYDFQNIQSFMGANASKGDVLISSTPYLRHITWTDVPAFAEKFPILMSPNTKSDYIISLTHQYNSGWIVIDFPRMEALAFSPLDVFSKENGLEYIGLFGEEYVWHWNRPQSTP